MLKDLLDLASLMDHEQKAIKDEVISEQTHIIFGARSEQAFAVIVQ